MSIVPMTSCRYFLNPVKGSLVGGVAILLILLAVVLAHTGPTGHVMGDNSVKMDEAISTCLAIMQLGGAVMVGFLLGRAPRRKFSFAPLPPIVHGLPVHATRLNPGSRIREGPACQQVFRN